MIGMTGTVIPGSVLDPGRDRTVVVVVTNLIARGIIHARGMILLQFLRIIIHAFYN